MFKFLVLHSTYYFNTSYFYGFEGLTSECEGKIFFEKNSFFSNNFAQAKIS